VEARSSGPYLSQVHRLHASIGPNARLPRMTKRSIGMHSSLLKRRKDQVEIIHAMSYVQKVTKTEIVGWRCSSDTTPAHIAKS
jgi:hypothetical protein